MVSNALVTGGAGFIGSHLVERLLDEDRRVVIVDSLLRGRRALASFIGDRRVVLVPADIRAESVIRGVVADGAFDVVYHLAALHYIPECAAHPLEALSVNVVGTQTLLEALKVRPPRCLVFASTGDVYAPKIGPHEEADALGPISLYGLSKVFGEQLVTASSAALSDTSIVVARLFNAYGPRETNPHLIPSILDQVKHGGRLRLGNLWPRRDYVHVKDIAEALTMLGARLRPSGVDTFNVGTGRDYSVGDVLTTLEGILDQKLIVEVDKERIRPVERSHLQANIERLQNATGWRPRRVLDDGLRELCLHEQMLKSPAHPQN
jgi:UDP-glucose 4-epimerase